MASVLRSPDPERLQVLEVEVEKELILVWAETSTSGAFCPLCQYFSDKVHSRYVRTLADLPCSGIPVRWYLHVHRFRCTNAACSRKIFAERHAPGAPAYARRWLRQKSLLLQIAFVLGGRPGERFVHHVAMSLSNDSLLRLLRAAPLPNMPSVRVLGVDDWAFRKGKTYGTILVDLETKRVLDLLPNREKETLAAWLSNSQGSRSSAVIAGEHMQKQHGKRLHKPFKWQIAIIWLTILQKPWNDLCAGVFQTFRRLLHCYVWFFGLALCYLQSQNHRLVWYFLLLPLSETIKYGIGFSAIASSLLLIFSKHIIKALSFLVCLYYRKPTLSYLKEASREEEQLSQEQILR